MVRLRLEMAHQVLRSKLGAVPQAGQQEAVFDYAFDVKPRWPLNAIQGA